MPTSFSAKGAISLFTATDPEFGSLDEPTHPDARAFFAMWRKMAKNRDLVIGTDIPSRPFARFLGNAMIVEPIEDGRDCRIHVAGTLLRRRYGREVSGERLSTQFSSPEMFAEKLAQMRAVRETGLPLILAGQQAQDDALPLRFEAIIVRARAPKPDQLWNLVTIFPYTEV